jgi:hypothetical protein
MYRTLASVPWRSRVSGSAFGSIAAAWALRGNGTIEGAAVAQGSFDLGPGSVTLTYSPSILLGARFLNGSFVKVPGGWRDLQP